MKRYENYKDSGVQWLGEIPEHWEILPSKRYFYYKKEINKNYISDNVLSLTLRGVVNNDIENPEGLVPKDYATYQYFEKENLVFKLIDLENVSTSRVGIVHENGIMSSAYIRLISGSKIFNKYAYYFYFSLYKNQVFNKLGSGVRSTLNPTDLLNLSFVKPPLSEQTTIANFLDDKTAKIDQAIAIKEKEIALLKERRQILIQKAVTKGLDPNVKMKDSGVDWIGEIPEHWQIESFKNILTERNKNNYPIRSRERLSLSIDKGITLYSEKTTNLDRFKDDFTQYKLAYEGDLVFNSMNMIVGAVGVSNYFGCISPVYYTYYSASNNFSVTKFFEYLFKTRVIQGVLYSLGRGIMAIDRGEGKFNTVRLKVSRSDLRCLKLPLPKLNDQEKIVSYLEQIEEKIAKAISLKQQEIEKLKEYKTVLIDNVVTGKERV